VKHRDKVFKGRAIRLDGNQYEGCTFDECLLEIGGAAPFKMDRCARINCETVFVGAAGNVMVMLAQLYADPESRAWVDRLFEQLKRGGLNKSQALKFPDTSGFDA
jgi:hypothetical protein